jgi:hypothetical protein
MSTNGCRCLRCQILTRLQDTSPISITFISTETTPWPISRSPSWFVDDPVTTLTLPFQRPRLCPPPPRQRPWKRRHLLSPHQMPAVAGRVISALGRVDLIAAAILLRRRKREYLVAAVQGISGEHRPTQPFVHDISRDGPPSRSARSAVGYGSKGARRFSNPLGASISREIRCSTVVSSGAGRGWTRVGRGGGSGADTSHARGRWCG